MPHPHHADACDKTRTRLLHQRDQAATIARHATRIAHLAIGRLHQHDPQAAIRLHRALARPDATPEQPHQPPAKPRRDLMGETTAWLTRHPDQWTTARVIARGIAANDGMVRQALHDLHAKGLVQRRDLPGGGAMRRHEWRLTTAKEVAV